MFNIIAISYVLTIVTAYDHFVSINCGSYERTMVSTKYANYTSVIFSLHLGFFLLGIGFDTRSQANTPRHNKKLCRSIIN